MDNKQNKYNNQSIVHVLIQHNQAEQHNYAQQVTDLLKP